MRQTRNRRLDCYAPSRVGSASSLAVLPRACAPAPTLVESVTRAVCDREVWGNSGADPTIPRAGRERGRSERHFGAIVTSTRGHFVSGS